MLSSSDIEDRTADFLSEEGDLALKPRLAGAPAENRTRT